MALRYFPDGRILERRSISATGYPGATPLPEAPVGRAQLRELMLRPEFSRLDPESWAGRPRVRTPVVDGVRTRGARRVPTLRQAARWTTSPPSTPSSTRASRNASGSSSNRSSETTTRSASLPGVRLPSSCSRWTAYALPRV